MAIAEMPGDIISTNDDVKTNAVAARPCTILSALQSLATSSTPLPITSARTCAASEGVEHTYPYNVLLRDKLIAIESRGDVSYFRVTQAGRGMIAAVRSLTP
jgi:hypothetical protein